MGKTYTGKKPLSTKSLFYKKQNYKRLIGQTQQDETGYGPNHKDHFLNYHAGEYVLFGKVNKAYIPIIPSKKYLKTFPATCVFGESRSMQALDFVVDQFEQMAQVFRKSAMAGKIAAKDQHLSELKIHRAYQDPRASYENYFNLLSTTLQGYILSHQIDIINFNEFMQFLLRMLKESALEFPFTFPGYIKSKHYSSTNSGLVLEIANLDFNNDEEKVNKFFYSMNWDFWLSTCNTFGFSVDANAPWRIMADLDSLAMKHQASRYGSAGSIAVLSSKFKSAPHNYIYNFYFQQLLNLYNKVRKPQVVKVTLCDDNSLKTTVHKTHTYTLESLREEYSVEYFMQQYFQMRFLEEESTFTAAEKQRLIQDCVGFVRRKQTYKAILYFEAILNKPFDYVGSVSYTSKVQEEIDELLAETATEEVRREIERELWRVKQRKGLT